MILQTYDMEVLDFHDPNFNGLLMQEYLSSDGVDRVYVVIKTPLRHNQDVHFMPDASSQKALRITSHPHATHDCEFDSSLTVSPTNVAGQTPFVVLWDLSVIVDHADTYFWSALIWVCGSTRTHDDDKMKRPLGAVEVRRPLPTAQTPAGRTSDSSIWSSGPTLAAP